MMKFVLKIAAFAVAAIMILFVCSCGKNEEKPTETSEPETTSAGTTAEYGEPRSLPLTDTVTYKDSETEFSMPKNSISVCTDKGDCKISKTDNTVIYTVSDVTLPFGIKCGDDFDSVCRKASLEKGYAIYGENGKSPEAYDENAGKIFDGTKEVSLMFGYKVVDGESISADASMLEYIISGKIVSNYDFDTVLFSMSFDKDGKLTYSCEIYSDYAVFRDILR